MHTKDESKRATAFASIFGVHWLWRCDVTASFGVYFHVIKRNGMISFTEFTTRCHLKRLMKQIRDYPKNVVQKVYSQFLLLPPPPAQVLRKSLLLTLSLPFLIFFVLLCVLPKVRLEIILCHPRFLPWKTGCWVDYKPQALHLEVQLYFNLVSHNPSYELIG